MANDATNIRVAANGKISVAPYSAAVTLPTDPTEALDAAFVDLGYVNEDGVQFSMGVTIEQIRVWQKATPGRQIVTERTTTATFSLSEYKRDTFALAFGGGTWTEVTAPSGGANGVYRYDPPADTDELAEYVLVIDSVDGDEHDRWVVFRGSVTGDVETNMVRTGASLLPVTFSALAPDDENRAWAYVSDADGVQAVTA